jgi:hypothetical protein
MVADAGSVPFRVWVGNVASGSASLIQKGQPGGGKLVELRVDLRMSSQSIDLRSQNTYDAKGNPIRKFQEVATVGVPGKKQTVVTFDAAGANVVILDGGKRSTKSVALVKGANRADVSQFWFFRDKPKPGTGFKVYQFNLDRLTWDLAMITYIGPKVVMISKRKVQTHEIRVDLEGRILKVFVDDGGLPVILDDGRIKLERQVS